MARGGGHPVVAWPGAHEGPVCVGFSGGLDSTVLLHALHETARAEGRLLTALHVHHGLSPHAGAWADFCGETCARLGIPLDVVRVRLDRGSGLGLEAEARRARYAVYAAREEPFVALGHHLDDQAETVLLQLLRGTGLKGVAAMPALRRLNERVTLYRPLLAYSRAELEAHARAAGLRWIDDESNTRTSHDRNFLRHEVGPLLDARFPAWRESVARFARHASDAQGLLDELAGMDAAPLQAGAPLPLDPSLGPARRANVVRAFLAANALAMPSDARLAQMVSQLYEAREDALVRIEHDGVCLTRHRGQARIEAPPLAPWRVPWHGEREVDLGAGLGEVAFEECVGAGLCAERAGEGDWFFAPRAGGERLRLAADRPRRTLKNLLQESGLTPGERARLPLLFRGEDVVWAPGIGIAAEYACRPGGRGLRPVWRVAGNAPLC